MRPHRLAALLVLVALALTLSAAFAEPLTPDQVQQVERVIREYLLKHPELLIEMSNSLRAQQEKAKSERAQQSERTPFGPQM